MARAPDVHGLNPVIGKNYIERLDENNEKEAGNGPFLKLLGTPSLM